MKTIIKEEKIEQVQKLLSTGLVLNSQTIMNNSDINSDAEVRKYINELRKRNVPIIATRKGYRFTNNTSEIIQYAIKLKKREKSIGEAAEGLFTYINNKLI